jgi:DNA-binding GntR family transcriptional regulator
VSPRRPRGVIARSAAEHEVIVDAAATRDAELAAEAMRAHLHSVSRATHAAMAKLRGSSGWLTMAPAAPPETEKAN